MNAARFFSICKSLFIVQYAEHRVCYTIFEESVSSMKIDTRVNFFRKLVDNAHCCVV